MTRNSVDVSRAAQPLSGKVKALIDPSLLVIVVIFPEFFYAYIVLFQFIIIIFV